MTYQTVLDALMRNGELTETQADRVFQAYRKHKILKYNAHDGYQLTHGAFFDGPVIKRAVTELR